MLGNVLFIDPDIFDLWMDERGLPVHVALKDEPIIPESRLAELNADNELISKELLHIFSEAGVTPDQIHTVTGNARRDARFLNVDEGARFWVDYNKTAWWLDDNKTA